MNKITDLLSGQIIIDEVDSPINGKLQVVRDIAWGTHITGGGLTQSGGVAKSVWNNSLKKVHAKKPIIKNALILGLGGGSIAELIHKYWPASPNRGEGDKVKIVGVDIDPVFINLGKKHLKLDEYNVKDIIDDAYEYVKTDKHKHDLICIDTYVGDQFPESLEEPIFIKRVKGLLNKNGMAVFNRLYYDEKRRQAEEFEKVLEDIFDEVERNYPEANIMFLCTN
jgi:spermidine synthase